MDTHLVLLLLAIFSAHLGQHCFVAEAKAWEYYDYPVYEPLLGLGHPTIPEHTPEWVARAGGHSGASDPSGRLLFPSKTHTTKVKTSISVSKKQEGKWIEGVQQIGGQRFYNYSYVKDTINTTNAHEDFETNKTVWLKRRKRDMKVAALPLGPFNENN